MGYRLNGNGKNPVDVVRCGGNLNATQMVHLKNRLSRLVNQNHRYFLLDLKRARWIDVAGISILVERIQKVRSLRGDIRLVNLQPKVQEMLHYLGIDDMIETYSNEEEGVQSFKHA
ncbi:MAG: hypothetical protein A3G33_11485 [Omnitrophica bacterium RIFCSPLOWO2_12_FULL_44_17]|uniref:Anti-sigma factor antagonist n=1 Tax=Candidatus Danuiimicrobium aquiferis TaxID=1801832 RepID=A0A1G1KRP7_9BACT|nr:MAG: hypothetical protein A3B72_09325 [Omnitrophica bacterium RIFCSPHIGHO2_02_FULL_45_28]OGW91210.1 MAG: hypothetical protein A3E74_02855 [Omnitrophica bacterium RIFCSPHIGHO2_12_FULL_44_12]OGW95611.1 MAG: hypothetical protein A3G33_11485 [Omnitrophica bacterium RIFCSPLOWO2_12_FULL_44_17]OGX03676.1 MAG: hypothetical protein A3J12_01010 [Omnitrophica bacterium RIFCSPLOWO2_02_FULL_44_11]